MSTPLSGLHPSLSVSFGEAMARTCGPLHVGIPILEGEAEETIFSAAQLVGERGRFRVFSEDGWLIGCASVPAEANPVGQSFAIYEDLLAAVSEHQFCRIWNYVPRINEPSDAGMSVYRAFSLGRSRAFEAHFGRGFTQHLPAASAVGSDGDDIVVVFAAHRLAPTHFENPLQVPAYQYPVEHGPRSPSFARASAVPRIDGHRDVFISGTSAILGHTTVAPGQTVPQLECTIENLRVISAECGIGCDLAAGAAQKRFFKVYLRHPDDLGYVAGELDGNLIQPGDHVTYLRADICRPELNLEIEATILGARPLND